jgi:hypothetical protein
MESSITKKWWLLPLCFVLFMVRMVMSYSDSSLVLIICGILGSLTSSPDGSYRMSGWP